MPLRELHCGTCDTQVEVLLSMTEPDPPCPECKAPRVRLEIPLQGSAERRPDFGAWMVELVPRADAALAELGCPAREVT